jgi:hypothetical protein
VRRRNIMLSLNPPMWCTSALFVILAPSPAPAQTLSNSFEELRLLLKNGQTVVVTDATGQRTKGKVADVSSSSLVVLVPDARTFTERTVSEIRASDPVWNGALIGAAIGTGLALWDYLIDPSEPGNAVVFTVAIGLGTAIGAGIDALVNRGGTLLYVSPRPIRRVMLSPILGKDRQGALVSVRF